MNTVAIHNRRLMHLLERIAAAFNKAGLPLLVLKGGALQLALPGLLNRRPMDDLDLLIHPENLERARGLLAELGATPGARHPCKDFCPRFHYEEEFILGSIYPVKIDLHVRPLRPLRYSRLVPPDALWSRAESARIGRATIGVPAPEDMLIHLAAHAAIHGCSREVWLRDISLWTANHVNRLDWDGFLETAETWRLALPVLTGLRRAANQFGEVCPARVLHRLEMMRVRWPDRLALWHAPRDKEYPLAHVLVNALCTPGWRFKIAYLRSISIHRNRPSKAARTQRPGVRNFLAEILRRPFSAWHKIPLRRRCADAVAG